MAFSRIFLISSLVLLTSLSSWGQTSMLFSDLKTQDLITGKDDVFSVSKIKKVSVVFFWASWCEYCKAMAIDMNRTLRRNPTLEVIGINVDDEIAKGQRDYAINYRFISRHYYLAKSKGEGFYPKVLPYIVIIGKNGKIDSVYEGTKSDKVEYFQKRIRYLLEGNSDDE